MSDRVRPLFTHEENSELVSVIIPCYNQARFLTEAISSVLRQTYRNYEIIVVDDGATDATSEIVQQYQQVRYLKQKRQGLASARNVGIQASRARYLVFLDADDRLLPDALVAGLRCIEEHPDCAFVSGGHRRIDEVGVVIEEPTPPLIEKNHYLALLQGNYVGMHGAVMYRRDYLAASGGFNCSLPACEDYELYLRLARTHSVRCHEAVVAEYRTYGSSMSGDTTLMLPTVLKVLSSQRKHLKDDPPRKRAYHAGLRYWTDLYAKQFVTQLSQTWARGERGKAMRSMSVVNQHAPRQFLKSLFFKVVLPALSERIRRLRSGLLGPPHCPPPGRIRYGDLRRIKPISNCYGFDRGLPIDRYYIEKFLSHHAGDMRERVLEIGDSTYTRRFGGDRIAEVDVLDVSQENPFATLVADLTCAGHIPSNTFDCAIVTQTLQLIYDVRTALATLHRILKPNGVLLLTVPGISQISRDQWAESWHWSFTSLSIRRLLEQVFPGDRIAVEAHGNVLAATAFLQGIAAGELERSELDFRDPQYEVLITARASKPARWDPS